MSYSASTPSLQVNISSKQILAISLPIALAILVPQINFVHVNVVENVSKYFGSDPYFFYIKGFRWEFCTVYAIGLFGLSLFTVHQVCGSLKSFNTKVEGASRIPSILTFIVACLTVLSMVDHKELRFYAPVT